MKVIAFLFATLALVGAFAPAQQSRQSTKLYKAFWDNVSSQVARSETVLFFVCCKNSRLC